MQKVWKWLNHNRFVVIGPVVGLMLWAYALGCTPETISPLDISRMVNASRLDIDFKTWQAQQEIMTAKFDAAGKDLIRQEEQNAALKETILGLASSGIPDMPGLLKLLVGGGGLGAIIDNIRKGGVIGGLKRNNKSA